MREASDTPAGAGEAIRAQTRAARQERGIAARSARRVQWRRWTGLLALWQLGSWLCAVVLTMLVGFGWIKLGFFHVVVSVSCLPLFTQVLARPGWLLERQLRAGADAALTVGHLPPRLARLAEETRMLRLAIEAAAPDDPGIEGLGWAWVSAVRELGALEMDVVDRLGVSHHDVAAVLLGEALAPEMQAAVQGVRPVLDPEAQRRRVELLAEHLEAFEVALLRHDPDPYRGS